MYNKESRGVGEASTDEGLARLAAGLAVSRYETHC